MPIPTMDLDRYRRMARNEGIPESCIDATIRWIFNAAVSAIDIAWGESSVQHCLLENRKNLSGTQGEHAIVSSTSFRQSSDLPAPPSGGKG